tara:strand:- start:3082 stop:4182 length:1101 start_codon:yes stop_codon:yes gene_type:complete
MKKNIFKSIFKSDSTRLMQERFQKFSTSNVSNKIRKKLKTNIFELINLSKSIQIIQDKIEKLANNSNPNQVILTQSKIWGRAITWVLMSGTAFAIGWISIAKTDEVVIATGKLEPIGGVVDVQMPLEGIAREILVKEGQKVKKGDVLIKLDTEITEAKNESLQKNLEINQIILNKLELLVQEGAVSELQLLQHKTKIEDLKTQIKTNQVMLRYQEIRSPLDGLVFELKPKGSGYVAKSSQPVMQIVPIDNLLAKVEIDNRTIGFVKTGKKAEISIDSFPATDFGVINGTVTRIGSDSLEPVPSEGKGYRFPAEIKLNEQHLKIKSGQILPLKAGMSLTANIKLRKVTYLQLFLNKFSDKADSLKSI